MTTITTQTGEAFFLIDPRHTAFVREESPHLKDHHLTWLQRFAIFALVIISTWLLAGQLLVDSIRAGATVLDKAEGPDIGTYFLTYSFSVDTTTGTEPVTVEQQISYETFARVEVGDTVTVQYQPGNAENAHVVEREAIIGSNSLMLFATLLLIAAAAYVLVVWIIRPDRRNRRLEYEGTLLRGKIIEIYPRKQPRRYPVTVTYECRLPDETVLTATTTQNRVDLQKSVLPRLGTPVLVLYVNADLYRLM